MSHKSLAAPAHFWLSDDAVSPDGPNIATNISIEEGTVGTLYIWGRPETGKKLRNISLNLVALQAGIDFVDSSITMHNDAGGGIQRYEYVSDSTSTPALESGETLVQVSGGNADSIELLQGYSLSASAANVKGVGNQCVDAETGCVLAGDGLPAWLIATVDYNAIVGGPVTSVHLQIGEHGINHESLVSGDYDLNGVVDNDDLTEAQTNFSSTANLWPDGNGNGRVDAADYTIWQDNLGSVSAFEAASLTSVRFGADTVDGSDEPIYDASTDRDVTLAKDDPDAIITMFAPLQAAQAVVPEPTSISLLCVFSLISLCATRRSTFLMR
ncbi:MAG: hypothetical protein ABGX16_05095 [Pirellulales bacterium]